jgi:3-hydroxybutyryl-CoA dehydrogenase
MEFTKVGVLGAGNIGTGVVTDLVLHGISTVVVDVSEEILQRARADVLKNIRVVPLLSKTLPRITKEEAATRMLLTTDLKDVAACDFIIENVTEN